MKAPVVIFAYNRKEHLRRTIEALGLNMGIEDTAVYIFADQFGKKEEQEKTEAVRAYIEKLEQGHPFQSLHVKYAAEHKGLAASVISGVTEVIERYGRVIVVEDDLYTSKDFLKYMNQALDFYEKEPVWSISGYSFPMKHLKQYPHDIFYCYRACSWGWATWKDRWSMVDWEVKDFAEFRNDRKEMWKFNRGGTDLTPMLCEQMEGKRDSWAIRWCFAQSKKEMPSIYPKDSRVVNMGFDGSGSHCLASTEYETILNYREEDCRFEILDLDKQLMKEFRDKYSDTFWKKVKRRLKTVGNKRL